MFRRIHRRFVAFFGLFTAFIICVHNVADSFEYQFKGAVCTAGLVLFTVLKTVKPQKR